MYQGNGYVPGNLEFITTLIQYNHIQCVTVTLWSENINNYGHKFQQITTKRTIISLLNWTPLIYTTYGVQKTDTCLGQTHQFSGINLVNGTPVLRSGIILGFNDNSSYIIYSISRFWLPCFWPVVYLLSNINLII